MIIFVSLDELSIYRELNVGDVVQVTVSSALKKGILGDLPSGAKALATKVNLGGLLIIINITFFTTSTTTTSSPTSLSSYSEVP